MGAGGVGAIGARIGQSPEAVFIDQRFAIFAGKEVFGFQAQLGADFGSTFMDRGEFADQADAVGERNHFLVSRPPLLFERSLRIGPEAATGANLAKSGENGVVGVNLFALQDVLITVAIGDFDPDGRVVAEEIDGRVGVALSGGSSRSCRGAGALGPSGRFRFVVRVFSHNFSLL